MYRRAKEETTLAVKRLKSGTSGRQSRRSYQRTNITNIPRSVSAGFPQFFKCSHKYVAQVQLVGTTGTTAANRFIANGMYDPDFTGGGHQPSYFDTLSAVYQHWVVLASNIRVRFTPQVAAQGVIGITITDGAAIPTTAVNYMEQPQTTWTTVAQNSAYSPVLTLGYRPKRQFGFKPYGDPNMEGSSSSGPAETSEFVVWAADGTGGAVTFTTCCTVEIDYLAMWFELKSIPQS